MLFWLLLSMWSGHYTEHVDSNNHNSRVTSVSLSFPLCLLTHLLNNSFLQLRPAFFYFEPTCAHQILAVRIHLLWLAGDLMDLVFASNKLAGQQRIHSLHLAIRN